VQEQLDSVAKSLAGKSDPTWEEIVLQSCPPGRYAYRPQSLASMASALLQELNRLATMFGLSQGSLSDGAPRPEPEMKIQPKV